MLYVIGLGPGKEELMSQEALQAIKDCEIIVGYSTYMRLIKDLVKDKEMVATGMRHEIERCQKAIDLAHETGKNVGVVSSGDAGVYGMAGLILELLEENDTLEVKVVPGITASLGAAAVMGAPLMNDFCHISLSDLMTPWEMIEKRLHAAAQGDFVVCLYNPRSKGRHWNLKQKKLCLNTNRKIRLSELGRISDVRKNKLCLLRLKTWMKLL